MTLAESKVGVIFPDVYGSRERIQVVGGVGQGVPGSHPRKGEPMPERHKVVAVPSVNPRSALEVRGRGPELATEVVGKPEVVVDVPQEGGAGLITIVGLAIRLDLILEGRELARRTIQIDHCTIEVAKGDEAVASMTEQLGVIGMNQQTLRVRVDRVLEAPQIAETPTSPDQSIHGTRIRTQILLGRREIGLELRKSFGRNRETWKGGATDRARARV